MLFDEKDLKVFNNDESREYFKEILQLYYSRNYRATIVMLYSFVIYDLYTKLQFMANEGDSKAKSELDNINEMIKCYEKYSKVESTIIEFYTKNCQLYFDRFQADIEYLIKCRHKCAHLKVNDNSMYVPTDYQVRMLICSMFDNILSVQAPFIMELFPVVKTDIENYSREFFLLDGQPLPERVNSNIRTKYLERMTTKSLINSYSTFIRLLLISNDEDCIKNLTGIWVFTYSITDYVFSKGYGNEVINNEKIVELFNKINIEELDRNVERQKVLINLVLNFAIIMDIVRSNKPLFEKVSHLVLDDYNKLYYYKKFYPRKDDTNIFEYFKSNSKLHKPAYSKDIYDVLKKEEPDKTDLFDFSKIMIQSIPWEWAYDDADAFMNFFIENISNYNRDQINEIMDIYNRNPQCYRRNQHIYDSQKIQEHLKTFDDDSACV